KKSYHGVAMGATSATGIPEFHKFTTSIAPDFYYVDSSVEALQEMIDTEGADSIAAFISEPVQGSGGVNIPSEGYFEQDRKSTRLNSSHVSTSYAVFCLRKKMDDCNHERKRNRHSAVLRA